MLHIVKMYKGLIMGMIQNNALSRAEALTVVNDVQEDNDKEHVSLSEGQNIMRSLRNMPEAKKQEFIAFLKEGWDNSRKWEVVNKLEELTIWTQAALTGVYGSVVETKAAQWGLYEINGRKYSLDDLNRMNASWQYNWSKAFQDWYKAAKASQVQVWSVQKQWSSEPSKAVKKSDTISYKGKTFTRAELLKRQGTSSYAKEALVKWKVVSGWLKVEKSAEKRKNSNVLKRVNMWIDSSQIGSIKIGNKEYSLAELEANKDGHREYYDDLIKDRSLNLVNEIADRATRDKMLYKKGDRLFVKAKKYSYEPNKFDKSKWLEVWSLKDMKRCAQEGDQRAIHMLNSLELKYPEPKRITYETTDNKEIQVNIMTWKDIEHYRELAKTSMIVWENCTLEEAKWARIFWANAKKWDRFPWDRTKSPIKDPNVNLGVCKASWWACDHTHKPQIIRQTITRYIPVPVKVDVKPKITYRTYCDGWNRKIKETILNGEVIGKVPIWWCTPNDNGNGWEDGWGNPQPPVPWNNESNSTTWATGKVGTPSTNVPATATNSVTVTTSTTRSNGPKRKGKKGEK